MKMIENKIIDSKLKELEYNLHHNNVFDKKSSCFWCTCDFDNPAIHIPKKIINDTYQVYGCFCSPECATAYLIDEKIDTSTRFERYFLLNNIYCKIYNYEKILNLLQILGIFLINFMEIYLFRKYRKLLKNERLLIVVDKPLIRILPELHQDNDEYLFK